MIHHSNQFGLGGTEKDMLLFLKYMDKNLFEAHALTRKVPVPPHRVFLDRVRAALGSRKAETRLAQYSVNSIRIPDFIRLLGEDHVHFYTRSSLPGILRKLGPQILHVHHSGVSEPPINQPDAVSQIPIIFTINGFGFQDTTPHDRRVTRILFPSYWIQEKIATWSHGDPRSGVLYCPIEKPYTDQNLRQELGIQEGTFVVDGANVNVDILGDNFSNRLKETIETCLKTR